VIAAKNSEPDELVAEASDLIYHLAVLLNYKGLSFDDVFEKLTERHSHKRRDEYGSKGKIKNKK
jgi:phosphoribosyl-ATP pyrophosphohydrolase